MSHWRALRANDPLRDRAVRALKAASDGQFISKLRIRRHTDIQVWVKGVAWKIKSYGLNRYMRLGEYTIHLFSIRRSK